VSRGSRSLRGDPHRREAINPQRPMRTRWHTMLQRHPRPTARRLHRDEPHMVSHPPGGMTLREPTPSLSGHMESPTPRFFVSAVWGRPWNVSPVCVQPQGARPSRRSTFRRRRRAYHRTR
jgi:hypothetical protein